MLMQSLLQRGINWDEPLPLDVTVGWNDMRHDLARAADTEIPRCYFIQGAETSNDKILHVFTDSSMKAYGAGAYIVSENENTCYNTQTWTDSGCDWRKTMWPHHEKPGMCTCIPMEWHLDRP